MSSPMNDSNHLNTVTTPNGSVPPEGRFTGRTPTGCIDPPISLPPPMPMESSYPGMITGEDDEDDVEIMESEDQVAPASAGHNNPHNNGSSSARSSRGGSSSPQTIQPKNSGRSLPPNLNRAPTAQQSQTQNTQPGAAHLSMQSDDEGDDKHDNGNGDVKLKTFNSSNGKPGSQRSTNGWTDSPPPLPPYDNNTVQALASPSSQTNGPNGASRPGHTHSRSSVIVMDTNRKFVLSEFAREMEHKFGAPHHSFGRLTVRRVPFFKSPKFHHLLHKPQLKQYFKNKGTVLVRQNFERKPHWNELFFDLVFICVFQRVAHELHNSETLDGKALTEFSVLFCAAWKIWFDLTVYVNQFDPADTFHKVYFMTQMIFVMGLAIMSVKGVIGSYLVATGVTLALRCWSAWYNPRARQDAYMQVFIYFISAIPWLASLSISSSQPDNASHTRAEYEQFELWGAGLIIAFGGQFIAQCFSRFHIPLNTEHITERMGIFTILCMGEQVVELLFSDWSGTKDSFLMACLGGVMIFALQIIYFDVDGFNHKMHALRGSRFRGYLWALLHCPFQGAIIVSSVTFRFFIDSTLKETDVPNLDLLDEAVADIPTYSAQHTITDALWLGKAAETDVLDNALHGGVAEKTDITAAHRQLFCIANGSLLLILFVIACLHVGRDGHVIRRGVRLVARAFGTLAMLCLWLLGDRISPLGMMSYAGLMLMFVAILDIYGNYVPKKKYLAHGDDGSNGVTVRETEETIHPNGDNGHEPSESSKEDEDVEPSVMSRNW